MNTAAATTALIFAGLFSTIAVLGALTHQTSGMLASALVSGLWLEVARELNRFGL